jgi:type IV pilus assembly protein PilC
MHNSTYFWQGITHLGVKKYGIIYAKSKFYAKEKLRDTNIILRTITKRIQIMSITQKAWFCRQIATLINAHIPLYTALELLHTDNQDQQFLIATLLNDLEHGKTLAESLQQHPQIFDDFFCNIIAIGESSGTLQQALNLIAIYYENIIQIHKNIKKTLSYPLIVFSLGWVIIIGICTIIVPQFEDLFDNSAINLPLLTKIIIWFSHILCNYGIYILLIIIGIICIQYKTNKFTHQIIKFFPIINKIYQKITLTKLMHTLSMTCSAGISLIEALELISKNITNKHYAATLRQIINDIHGGHEITDAFTRSALFPQIMLNMLKIGSDSTELTNILHHMAKYCLQDLEENLAVSMRLLEPLITTLLGIFVGGIVAALYIPLLQLGNIVSL